MFKTNKYLQKLSACIHKQYKLLLAIGAGGALLILCLVVLCWRLVTPNGQFILHANDHQAIKDRHIAVGLVLGAGITKQGKPYKELQARLDTAADALDKQLIEKLILSGDNRFANYDEPTAMRDYLVQTRHIESTKLQVDFAGRSTYESCERANKVFGQRRIVIFSAESHLPRAIYLCRHMNIEAYGISSGVEANNSRRRELLACVKAVFNTYIYGEKTVLGESIKL